MKEDELYTELCKIEKAGFVLHEDASEGDAAYDKFKHLFTNGLLYFETTKYSAYLMQNVSFYRLSPLAINRLKQMREERECQDTNQPPQK